MPLASSPVEKALEGSGLGPFGCPEPFFLVDSAKLLSVSCAANKASSVDAWRLVWGEIGTRSSLGEVLELPGTVCDAPGSTFRSWKMPSATQSFLVPWRMNSSMSSRRTCPLWRVRDAGRPHCGLCSSASDQLSIFARAGQDGLSRFLALLTFPKPKNLDFAGGWISSSTFWNRPARV